MKFRLASDIHSEFFGEDEMSRLAREALPPLPDDDKTTLILAGDIGSMNKPCNILSLLNILSSRFERIVYILGNHEYYGGDFVQTPHDIKDLLSHLKNVWATTAGSKSADTCGIHAHTLWTDFDKENSVSMLEAGARMNDYRLITNGYNAETQYGKTTRRLRPEDTLERHKEHVRCLSVFAPILPGDLIVTHHSPSLRSIPAEYLTDRVNGAYHSDLEWLIEKKKPAVWVHGHTHTACDYMIGSTRIICNPRGYGSQFKKNGYNATLTFEV